MRSFLSLFVTLTIFIGCTSKKSKEYIKDFEWQEVAILEKGNLVQPYLFSGKEKLFMSYTEQMNDSLSALKYMEFTKHVWSNPFEVAKGYDWFVNWADFSAIAENNKQIITHYLPKSDDATFAYDIFYKQFDKQERRWKDAVKLHSDTTKTEHGFVSLIPYKENSFFATWLDGRNTGGSHDHGHDPSGAMSLRATEILADGTKKNEVLLDAKTCDCCQTSAAITHNGPVVVYRDRSDNEIRDIYISRFVDGDWTLPKPIFNDGWKIAGCPVNGPKIAASNANLAIAWFTSADNTPKVKVIFSNDNGKTFDAPFIVDDNNPLGRVGVIYLDKENVLVSWMATYENGAQLKIAKVNRKQGKLLETTVGEIQASRASGFPQLALHNDEIFVAFNSKDNDTNTIKVKKLPSEFFK